MKAAERARLQAAAAKHRTDARTLTAELANLHRIARRLDDLTVACQWWILYSPAHGPGMLPTITTARTQRERIAEAIPPCQAALTTSTRAAEQAERRANRPSLHRWITQWVEALLLPYHLIQDARRRRRTPTTQLPRSG